MPETSSFTSKRVNSSTFVIREDDAYKEHPFIYLKIHPRAPIILLSDTGCDEPSEEHKNGRSFPTELRSPSFIRLSLPQKEN